MKIHSISDLMASRFWHRFWRIASTTVWFFMLVSTLDNIQVSAVTIDETKVEKDLRFQEAFEDSKIVPEIIPDVPWDELKVDYGNVSLKLGNTLVVHQAWRRPFKMKWPMIKGFFYTLLFLAPDHPDPANPRFRIYVLWGITNIRDGKLKEGDTFAEYIMPPPPEKKGRQRYVYLLYQQKPTGRQRFKEDYVPGRPEDRARANLSLKLFVSKYDLIQTPAAGNFFYINWGVTI